MKHFLKGVAAIVATLIVSMIIHVLCNMNGIDLNSPTTAVISALCAVSLYHILIRNEKK